jgi:hypothetical protein
MQKEAVTDAKQRPGFQKDLRDRTKAFALRIVRMFSALRRPRCLGSSCSDPELQSAPIIEKRSPEASEDFLMESPAVAAHPLRLPSSLFLSQPDQLQAEQV